MTISSVLQEKIKSRCAVPIEIKHFLLQQDYTTCNINVTDNHIDHILERRREFQLSIRISII